MIKLEFDKKSEIVYELLELLKKEKLNETQKDKMRNIVNGLTNRTDKQKERFLRLYNLLEDENKNYRLCDLALIYNCNPAGVRFSISRIRNNLINSNEENITIMKDILEEYHNKN